MLWSMGQRLGYLWRHKGESLLETGLAVLVTLIVLLIVPSLDAAVAAGVALFILLMLFAWHLERARDKLEIEHLRTHRAFQRDDIITHDWKNFLHQSQGLVDMSGLNTSSPYVDVTVYLTNCLPEAVTIQAVLGAALLINTDELPEPQLLRSVTIFSRQQEMLSFRMRLEDAPVMTAELRKWREQGVKPEWHLSAELHVKLFNGEKQAIYPLRLNPIFE
jgi:hypothetical protein